MSELESAAGFTPASTELKMTRNEKVVEMNVNQTGKWNMEMLVKHTTSTCQICNTKIWQNNVAVN